MMPALDKFNSRDYSEKINDILDALLSASRAAEEGAAKTAEMKARWGDRTLVSISVDKLVFD